MNQQLTEKVRSIKFITLIVESIGVRSICIYVETPDIRILLDTGGFLGFRFKLLFHPSENKAMVKCRNAIAEFADEV